MPPVNSATKKFGRLFSFAVAGGLGFIVDIGVLRLLIEWTGASAFTARIPAIAAAMLTTWFVNRTFTFAASGRSIGNEGMRYVGVALAGAVLNYLIYSGILLIAPAGFFPEIAVVLAVGIVTVFSYLGYARFVFGK